jgi:putative adenylate-forming enzyme
MAGVRGLYDLLLALAAFRKLESHDAWTATDVAGYQRRQLAILVRHAVKNSPFYRRFYDGLTTEQDISLHSLPVMNKRILMDNFDDVVTDPRLKLDALQNHLRTIRGDERYLGQYRVVATAGTSGLRGVFVYDPGSWRTVLANTIRWGRFTGIRPHWPSRVRLCSIGADNPMHVTQRIPDSGNIGLFRLLHLEATEPLANLVKSLNAFQPYAIQPYPSIAALLADEQLAGRLNIHPRVVATHSELLTADMAQRIAAAWGTKPFDHYGLTEEPHVASECTEHHGLHLFEDTCIVEVVDEQNRAVEPGVLGRKYLLTNLYNRTQPLIRYEVSDMLTMAAEPCSCGRPFSLISQIGGRSEDILWLKTLLGDKVAVPPLALSMRIEAYPEVAEYQAHHSPESISLQIVARPGADRDRLRRLLTAELGEALAKLGAVAPPVDVTFVEALRRREERMGKIKLIAAGCR